MKFTEQYFPVVLVNFVMLYKVVIICESVYEILKCDHSIEIYWTVLSCGTCKFYYAVQGGYNFRVCVWNPKVCPFKWKLLSSTLLWHCYYAEQGGSVVWVYAWNPVVWPLKWKVLSSTFLWYCSLSCTKWFLLLSVDETIKCDHSNESNRGVLSCGSAYYALRDSSKFRSCRWNR